ncbi:MAG: imidazoleglycerol-phosphate dehydratase HisB [Thermoprotei archaeon]|nr:MAG: imidazoleglycerol-phosphate dehydratase HisB [Thermoprotei archaeon]
MVVREAHVDRRTLETHVEVSLNLDGDGSSACETGFLFLDHLLKALAFYGGFTLNVKVVEGDLEHHIAEDVGITLGEALDKALGDKSGINRFGWAVVPMDEALVLVSVDISGRPHSSIELDLKGEYVEDIKSEDLVHMLESLARSARMSLHVKVLRGENDHHKAEAAFKALALALKQAVSRGGEGAPSTKGVI